MMYNNYKMVNDNGEFETESISLSYVLNIFEKKFKSNGRKYKIYGEHVNRHKNGDLLFTIFGDTMIKHMEKSRKQGRKINEYIK